VLDFSNFGSAQQDAAEYFYHLSRRCIAVPQPTTYELQQLPQCCRYNGFNCKIDTVNVTCQHGHSWVPDNIQDTNNTLIALPIPGDTALVHSSTRADSVPLTSCIDVLLTEVISDGRRCNSCNLDNVPYTWNRKFSCVSKAIAFQLRRGIHGWVGLNYGSKNFRHVRIPQSLDMAPYINLSPAQTTILHASAVGLLYHPVSIVVHTGLLVRAGHYVTYRRDPLHLTPDATAWECWNDGIITQTTWSFVSKQPAYLMFFECTDPSLLAALFP
jgi:hypothetical protein